ncbi:Uncharacterised protein g8373 [Pycnogonum litorale]
MDVKRVIQSLCKLLSYSTSENIVCELFRKAKFNSDECNEFDIILRKLILYVTDRHGSARNASLRYGNQNGCSVTTQEMLRSIGYKGELYNESSRSYLLALAWIIAYFSVVEAIIGDISSNSPILSQTALFSLKGCRIENDSLADCDFENYDVKTVVKEMMILIGRLDVSMKMIYSAKRGNVLLMHKINENMNKIFSKKNMTLLELFLLKNRYIHDKFVTQVTNTIALMESYIFWKQHENIFWKWMVCNLK